MTITERAALEGLRLRCLHEQAKNNRRLATAEEIESIMERISALPFMPDFSSAIAGERLCKEPLFRVLDHWLDLTLLGLAPWPSEFIAGIAIDILNKEEEGG